MITLNTHTTGRSALVALFAGLPDALQSGLLSDGVQAAAKPVERHAKLLAPRLTGALAKSIGTAVRRPRKSPRAYAVVGPLSSYYTAGKKGKGWSKGAVNPAKYAHLVEYGHIKVSPKKGTSIRKKTATIAGFVSPRPFLRPATIIAAAESEARFAAAVTLGLEKAVAKYNSAAGQK